jgi:hypothetical protein
MDRVSRRAIAVGAAAVCAGTALVCAGFAAADSPPVTTTDTATTDTTTTATTQTTDTTTTTAPTTTTPTDTTTTATTTTTTTTAPGTTSTSVPPSTATKQKKQPQPRGSACVGAGPLLLLLPGHAPRSVGSVAARVPAGVGATALEYPKNGNVLRVAAERADVSGCPRGTQHATATSSLRQLSLFGGAIRAGRVVATLVPAKSPGHKWRLRIKVKDLVIDGQPVTLESGESLPVGNWGRVKLDGGRHVQPGARVLSSVGLAWWQGGLSLRLTKSHAGLPAGTQLLVAYVGADRPFAPLPRAPKGGVPLTLTPPLVAGPYTFPVTGNAFFGDTYGAMRSDVPGGWHHGDDIFSPLGQPVVAVADGKVYKVGWNRVGGWRLWLKDAQGNRFYYAHLSGYTKYGRNGTHVKAGQQIAFIGNTGDAFTTPHHLHFEIHPARLLYLHYAGAVDPTAYLDQWRRIEHVTPLAPIPLPAGAATHGDGAVTDYRQLLAVRGIRRPPSAIAFPFPLEGRPIPIAAAAGLASTSTSFPLVPAITAALVALFGVTGLVVWKRRRVAGSAD